MTAIDTGQLAGNVIRLVPLREQHKPELTQVLNDPQIWEYTWRKIGSAEQAAQLVDTALANQAAGKDIPYVMVEQTSGRIVGTTRMMHVDQTHRGAEIGCTWIAPAFWRTAVNTEAKRLLLEYAFGVLGLIRVEFTIVSNNLRSQRAVERIGAVREGVLRKHRMTPEGTVLDNVVYSITVDEWPAVKDRLQYLLNEKYK